ncbi:MAG: HPr family phosphocarrier protein [Deltaproteobacteria bacterium]|nr:HPr family phosphocarrier protein [Deltaproteobacteria bacterium]
MDGDDAPAPAGRAKGAFTVTNQLGLHARAAAQFVNIANRFESEIMVRKGREAANGKSIMGVLMLAAAAGSVIEIEAEGRDAGEAVRRIGALIDGRFGEGQ